MHANKNYIWGGGCVLSVKVVQNQQSFIKTYNGKVQSSKQMTRLTETSNRKPKKY